MNRSNGTVSTLLAWILERSGLGVAVDLLAEVLEEDELYAQLSYGR